MADLDLKKNMVHYVKKIDFLLDNILEHQNKIGRKNLKVLDVGCGVGNLSIAAAKQGCGVLGIDIDKSSISYARKRCKLPNCRFMVSDAHSLKMEEKFDVIICSEVLEHLKYPEKLIESVSKMLNRSGFIFLAIPNGYGPSELSCMPRRFIGEFLKAINLFEFAKRMRHFIVKNSVKKSQKSFGIDTLNTYGEGALHEHFFTIYSLKRLLGRFNLGIVKRQNYFILVGTFPLYYLFSRSRCLQKIDCKLADYVPAFVSSGWSFIIRFRN